MTQMYREISHHRENDEEIVEKMNGENFNDGNNDELLQQQPETLDCNQACAILRDGNEVQRISILRKLPGFLAEKGNVDLSATVNLANQDYENVEQAKRARQDTTESESVNCKIISDRQADVNENLARILPEVQETLNTGTACLEFHFEASQAYRDIVEQSAQVDPDLCCKILQAVLQNLDTQDPIAATAWLESLQEIIGNLSPTVVQNTVLPVIIEKARQFGGLAQPRLIAAKLLGRVARKMPAIEVKTQIVPLMQCLCQDLDAAVRASVCQQLAVIAYSLSLSDMKSALLPLIIEFCQDKEENVREAALESVVSVFNLFDKETCTNKLVPLIEKFVADILDAKKPSAKILITLSRCFAALFHSMKPHLNPKQEEWFLQKFKNLCELGADEETTDGETIETERKEPKYMYISKHLDQQMVFLNCRENVAFSFPLIAESIGPKQFKTTLLAPFQKLCKDEETEVRRNVALNFHKIVKLMAGQDSGLLLDSFIDLVYSGESEVIAALTTNLTVILENLYKKGDTSPDDDEPLPYSHSQLTRILLACNRLIRNGSNWRCHEQYLLALACVPKCAPSKIILANYWPMIKEEILHTRAVPCRIAAISTSIIWLRDTSNPEYERKIVEFFTKTVLTHESCHKRGLFLDACQNLLDLNNNKESIRIFKDYFLPGALSLSKDPVANIRLKLCKLIPKFSKALDHNGRDQSILVEIETAIKNILNAKKISQTYQHEVIKMVTNELAQQNSIPEKKTAQIILKPVDRKISKENQPIISMPNRTKSLTSKFEPENPVLNGNLKQASMETLKNDLNLIEKPNITFQEVPITIYTSQPKKEPERDIIENSSKVEKPIPSREFSVKINVMSEKKITEPEKIDLRTRSPSPPPRRSTIVPISAMHKKTAIVRPRQLMTRSASPRPPLKHDETGLVRNSATSSTTNGASSYISKANSVEASKPPFIHGSTTTQYSSSSLPRRSSTTSRTTGLSYSSKPPSCTSFERVVPIKLMHSASASNIRAPTTSSSMDRSSSGIGNSWMAKPPMPKTDLTSSSYRRQSYVNPISNSNNSSESSDSYRKNSLSGAASASRSLPVSGMRKSVERFDSSPTLSRASLAPSRRFDNNISSTAYRNSTNSAISKPPSGGSGGYGLNYAKTMNRSFSSFPSALSSKAGDYDRTSSALPSSKSLMTQSVDRPSYALTRVQSGSSLASSANSNANSNAAGSVSSLIARYQRR